MNEIKIILVDDHDIVRDGLKVLLMNLSDIKVIGEVSTGFELFNLLQNIKPDIILMDISLPKMSGIVITKTISLEYPACKVIMLTASVNEKSVSESFKAGALGYLPKNIRQDELLDAIREVHKGNRYIAKSISDDVMNKYLSKNKSEALGQPKVEGELTKRELEIIELFAEGYNYKEVAERLSISYNTVETHKKNIFEKLEINSIVELVKYAIKHGIISV
ncbi:MAG: response regulator transcription factor [Bacteroidota bacterium]